MMHGTCANPENLPKDKARQTPNFFFKRTDYIKYIYCKYIPHLYQELKLVSEFKPDPI